MSELGIASRREADEWIARGWVRVDGRVVAELGSRVLPSQHITIDARARNAQAQLVTVLLNKPVGYVSGQAEDGYEPARVLVTPDASGARTAPGSASCRSTCEPRSRRPARHRLGRPAGADAGRPRRAPADRRGQHDREGVPRARRDRAAARRCPPSRSRCCATASSSTARRCCRRRSSGSTTTSCASSCSEGKKRQIRRMCDAVGLQVLGLKRVRIGAVDARRRCRPGQWRYLRLDERFVAGAPAR